MFKHIHAIFFNHYKPMQNVYVVVVHLVTKCHVSFAHVVCVPEVSALSPVHQCQTMEPFHRVSGKMTMV